MSRSVSNGDDVTLSDAGVRLRVLVHLERRADCVELWRENRALVESIGRGGWSVEAGFLVQVEWSGRLRIRLEVFVVRTGAIADLTTI